MILSKYEILETIAESSKSTVYKAYNKKSPSRLLVLKVVKTPLSEGKKSSKEATIHLTCAKCGFKKEQQNLTSGKWQSNHA